MPSGTELLNRSTVCVCICILTSVSGPLSAPGHENVTSSWQRLWTTKQHTDRERKREMCYIYKIPHNCKTLVKKNKKNEQTVQTKCPKNVIKLCSALPALCVYVYSILRKIMLINQ